MAGIEKNPKMATFIKLQETKKLPADKKKLVLSGEYEKDPDAFSSDGGPVYRKKKKESSTSGGGSSGPSVIVRRAYTTNRSLLGG